MSDENSRPGARAGEDANRITERTTITVNLKNHEIMMLLSVVQTRAMSALNLADYLYFIYASECENNSITKEVKITYGELKLLLNLVYAIEDKQTDELIKNVLPKFCRGST